MEQSWKAWQLETLECLTYKTARICSNCGLHV